MKKLIMGLGFCAALLAPSASAKEVVLASAHGEPQTKTTCVKHASACVGWKASCSKWAYPGFGAKICVGWTKKCVKEAKSCIGWKTEARQKTYELVAEVKTGDELRSEAESALKVCGEQAVAAGVVAGFASGSAQAGIATAQAWMQTCVKRRVPEVAEDAVSAYVRNGVTDWHSL